MKLEIELVPSTVWFSSLYRILPKNEWYRLKDKAYAKEGRECYICGSEQGCCSLHEFWEYNDDKYVQKLSGLHHLCDLCHKIKHIGFWCHTADGRMRLKQEGLDRDDLITHFCTVNNCAREEFLNHEENSLKVWRKRSKHQWRQDFGEYEELVNQWK